MYQSVNRRGFFLQREEREIKRAFGLSRVTFNESNDVVTCTHNNISRRGNSPSNIFVSYFGDKTVLHVICGMKVCNIESVSHNRKYKLQYP